MKLVIQIPAFNEIGTLAETMADLPDTIPGIDTVTVLVIDDGSTDGTDDLARKLGAEVVSHTRNKGLATTFATGVSRALDMGADIIVNTDADNQYCGADIPKLIEPIRAGRADMTIGARPVSRISHFSPVKKLLQKTGSLVVRLASGTSVPDAPSGFRALSREAAMKMNIFSKYTYTLETIIQAGMKEISVESVPISVNPPKRESRLLRSNTSYVLKSVTTIFRMFLLYRSFRFFALLGGILFSIGLIFGVRFMLFYIAGDGDGHVQSLILSAVLLITGFQTFLIGIVTDLIAANRRLLEDIRRDRRRRQHRETADERTQS